MLFRDLAALEPRRSEKHYCVLDLLPAKTRQGLRILRQNAENSSVGTIEKRSVLIRQRRAFGLIFTHGQILFREPKNTSGPFPFVVVDRFPKSDPDVQHPQAAAKPPKAPIGHDGPQ